MTPSELPETQRKVVPAGANQIPPTLSASLRQCFPQWLVRDILAPLAASRAALIIVAWLGLHLLQVHLDGTKWEVANDGYGHFVAEHLSPNSHPFVNMWARWDGGWYLDIAQHGYSFVPAKQSNVAFFPLYPYLIRVVHHVIPLQSDAGWLLVGIIVSNTALLVALIYLYQLIRLDYDRRTAARVVLYLCVFPTTLFLSAVYSESLFLALVVSAFYYARINRWLLVGVLSAAAALCRPPGVLLIAPLAFEYLSQKEFQWQRIKPDCLALLLAPMALAGHLTFLRWRFGDWNVLSKAETMEGWNRRLTLPWNTLLHSFPGMNSFKGFHGAFEFFFTLALLGLAIFGCFRLRLSYSIYAAVSLVFISSWGGLRSAPRFGLVIFPVIIALALLGHDNAFNRAYLVFSTILALISMVVFSQWGWVA
jgi:Mannosyltransferase (PIG-V)